MRFASGHGFEPKKLDEFRALSRLAEQAAFALAMVAIDKLPSAGVIPHVTLD